MAKSILDEMYENQMKQDLMNERMAKAYSQYLNSKPQNPYDNGSLWSLPKDYDTPFDDTPFKTNKYTVSNMYGLDKLYTDLGFSPKTPKMDFDFEELDPLSSPRNQIDYYTNKLNELGIEPTAPKEAEVDFSKMNAFDKFLYGVGKVLTPLDYATKPIQAVGNTVAGAFTNYFKTLDENFKNFEDNKTVGDFLKDTGHLLWDATVNPAEMVKNAGAGLKSGGSTLAGLFTDKYKENEVDFTSFWDSIYNSESKVMGGVGDTINAINPVSIVAENVFGVEEEKADEYGKLALGLATDVLLSPDLSDVSKGIKYLKNADKIDSATDSIKTLDKLEEATNLARKRVPIDVYKDEMARLNKPLSGAELDIAYDKHIKILADDLINENLKLEGAMPEFDGIGMDGLIGKALGSGKKDGRTIISREKLSEISQDNFKKNLTIAGLSMYSPLGAVLGSNTLGSIGEKIGETNIGKDFKNKFIGGRYNELKDLAKSDKDRSLEYLNMARSIEEQKNKYKFSINNTSKQIESYLKENNSPEELTQFIEDIDVAKEIKMKTVEETHISEDFINEISNLTKEEILSKKQEIFQNIKALGEKLNTLGKTNDPAVDKLIKQYSSKIQEYEAITSVGVTKTLNIKEALKGKIDDTDLEKIPTDFIGVATSKSESEVIEALKELGVSKAHIVAPLVMKHSNDALNEIDAFMPNLSKYFTRTHTEDITPKASDFMMSEEGFKEFKQKYKSVYGEEFGVNKRWFDKVDEKTEKGLLDRLQKDIELQEKKAEELGITVGEYRENEIKKLNLKEKEKSVVPTFNELNLSTKEYNELNSKIDETLGFKFKDNHNNGNNFTTKLREDFFTKIRKKFNDVENKQSLSKLIESELEKLDEIDTRIAKSKGIEVEEFRQKRYTDKLKEFERNKTSVKEIKLTKEQENYMNLIVNSTDETESFSNDTTKILEQARESINAIDKEYDFFNAKKQPKIEEKYVDVDGVNFPIELRKKIFDLHKTLDDLKYKLHDPNVSKLEMAQTVNKTREELVDTIIDQVKTLKISANDNLKELLSDMPLFPKTDGFGKLKNENNDLFSMFQMLNQKEIIRKNMYYRAKSISGSEDNLFDIVMNNLEKRLNGEGNLEFNYSLENVIFEKDVKPNENTITHKNSKIKSVFGKVNKNKVTNKLTDSERASLTRAVNDWRGNNSILSEVSDIADEIISKDKSMLGNHYSIERDFNNRLQTAREQIRELMFDSLAKGQSAEEFAEVVYNHLYKEGKGDWDNLLLGGRDKTLAKKHGKIKTVTKFVNNNINFDTFKKRMVEKMKTFEKNDKLISNFNKFIDGDINYDAFRVSANSILKGDKKKLSAIDDIYKAFTKNEITFDQFKDRFMTSYELGMLADNNYSKVEAIINTVDNELLKHTFRDIDNFYNRQPVTLNKNLAKKLLKEAKDKGLKIKDEEGFINSIVGSYPQEAFGYNGSARKFVMEEINESLKSVTDSEADILLIANRNRKMPNFAIPETLKVTMKKSEPFNSTSFMESNKYDDVFDYKSYEQEVIEQNKKLGDSYKDRATTKTAYTYDEEGNKIKYTYKEDDNKYALADEYNGELNPLDMEYNTLNRKIYALEKEQKATDTSNPYYDELETEIELTKEKLELTSQEKTNLTIAREKGEKIYKPSEKPVMKQIVKAVKDGKKSIAWHFRNNAGFSDDNLKQAILHNKAGAMYKANKTARDMLLRKNPNISDFELSKLMKEKGILTEREVQDKIIELNSTIQRMTRAELEISTHRMLNKSNDFLNSKRISSDEMEKFDRHRSTSYMQMFENETSKYLEKLGLNVPSMAFTKAQKSAYYGLYNLSKNMIIIKKFNPKLYDDIKSATNNFALHKIDKHTITYVNDMAFHFVKSNADELGEVSTNPLTKITGQVKSDIKDINDINVNSNSKLVAVTKEVNLDADLNQNPVFLFGASSQNHVEPQSIRTFLRFETGKNTVNVDISSKHLEGVDYENLDGVNIYLTDELSLGAKGYYRTDGKNHDIFLKNEGSYDVANHEYSHFIANSLKIPQKDYKKFGEGVREMLKGASDEKLDEIVSLVRDVNIDETTKELLKDGILTSNIKLQEGKFNEENFATLGSLFLHKNDSVRKKARELFGEDLYNEYINYASKVKKGVLGDARHNRIDFNNVLDNKLRRLSNIVEKNEIFAGTDERLNVSKLREDINELQTKLNQIGRIENLGEKDKYVEKLAEELNMNNPMAISKIREQVNKYENITKEIEEIDLDNLDFKNLSERQKEIVTNFRESMARMGYEEGLYDTLEEGLERLNYVPHQFFPDVLEDKVANEYVNLNKDSIRSPINHFEKERKIEGTIKSINDKATKKIGRKIFEDNLYRIWINRQIKSSNYVYRKNMFENLLETIEGTDSVNSLGKQINKGFGFKAVSIADVKNTPEVKDGMGLNNYYRALCERYNIEPIKKVSKDNPTKTYDSYIEGYYEFLNTATKNGYVIVKRDANIQNSTVANVIPNDFALSDTVNKGVIAGEMQKIADRDIQAITDFDPFNGYTVLNSSQIKEQEILSGDKGETFIIKKEAYEIYKKEMENAFKSDKSEFIKIYDKVNGLFKAMAVTSGKFHFNNGGGNVINSYVTAGVNLLNPKTFVKATKIMRGLDVNVKGYDTQDILYLMHKFNLLDNSQLSAEFNMSSVKEFIKGTSEDIAEGKSTSKKFNPASNDFMLYSLNKKVGDTIENHAKISNFITHLESGMSEVQAIELTKKALFDYSDLTEFETKVMKRLLPFFTFLRKNVPLQIENLANNPYRYYLIDKYTNEFSSINETEKERKLRPSYMKDDIALGGGKYLNLNSPIGDLDKITNPKELLNMITPMAKVPVEIALNRSIYTDSQISRTNKVSEYGKYAVKNMLPVTKLAENTRGAVNGDDKAMQRLLSMAGNPVRSYDSKKAEQSSMYDYLDKLKNQYYDEINNNPQLQSYMEKTKGKEYELKQLEQMAKKKKAFEKYYYENYIKTQKKKK